MERGCRASCRTAHITVRQLLNHTSGLYDFKDTLPMPPPGVLRHRWRTWTASELIQRALANPPTFDPPGSAYDYSNTNYLLLGEIIGKATGRSYAEEIERRLIRPLRLHGTRCRYVDADPRTASARLHPDERTASETRLHRDEPVAVRRRRRNDLHDADLNHFFAALLGGHLLRPSCSTR